MIVFSYELPLIIAVRQTGVHVNFICLPGGMPSHCAPETPGSINEGGELGYGIAHAFGAVFDNPDLIAAVTVGDGEAETGPKVVDGQRIEDNFLAHQVPIMRLIPKLKELAPKGNARIGCNPHGLTDAEYDILFTKDKPVIFAFHG